MLSYVCLDGYFPDCCKLLSYITSTFVCIKLFDKLLKLVLLLSNIIVASTFSLSSWWKEFFIYSNPCQHSFLKLRCYVLSLKRTTWLILQEIRELQELQKTFYTFLHVITTHDLSSVFLSTKSRGYLDKMMHLLLHSACNHKDILVRKVHLIHPLFCPLKFWIFWLLVLLWT